MELSDTSSEVDLEQLGGCQLEESEDTKCIKTQIIDNLRPIDFSGPFLTHTTGKNPCNPGLYLKDYGWLSLPFSADS